MLELRKYFKVKRNSTRHDIIKIKLNIRTVIDVCAKTGFTVHGKNRLSSLLKVRLQINLIFNSTVIQNFLIGIPLPITEIMPRRL